MHESALNLRLQEMRDAIGLFQRDTMHSLRRTAILETRRKEGTKLAQELAHHDTGGQSIFACDNESLEDYDLANERLDLDSANTARVQEDMAPAFVESPESLLQHPNAEWKRRAPEDPESTVLHDRVRPYY
ncbi:hypothetical protein LTR09_004103 [Extremus antarcticus]|uniref:Uncharacterized protein n=1 Tax=Extremus antarcticus TaxID=702011 RepID=A0AAJ0G9Y6_9PEZI|nr:hypothetical protein LTR09_004103 [Extremus antarcticus]